MDKNKLSISNVFGKKELHANIKANITVSVTQVGLFPCDS